MLETASETAAEQRDVYLNFVRIDAERLASRIADILRDLGRSPDFATVTVKICHRISRLHGSVGHKRKLILGLDSSPGDFGDIAGGIEHGGFAVHSLLQAGVDLGRVQIFVWPFIPGNLQRPAALHGAPYAVGNHRNRGVANLSDVCDTGNFASFLVIEIRDLAAKHRAARHARVLHIGNAEIDSVTGFSDNFIGGVEASQTLADNFVIFRLLEWRIGWHGQGGGFVRELSVAEPPVGRCMNDVAALRLACGARHSPFERSSGDQHLAGLRASFAHGVPGGAYTGAASSALVAVQHAGAGLLNSNLLPVGFQFLGENHGQRGPDALPHLRARDHDRDFFVRRNAQICVGSKTVLRRRAVAGKIKANHQTSSGCSAGGQEIAARKWGHCPPPAARWIALRMRS